MKHIQWRRHSDDSLNLYVINESYPSGVIYNMCRTPGVVVSDYNIPNGSRGYATMQNCLKLGYTFINTPKEND